ncbi:hypothetical protein B0H12DRAFT_1328963 [Mycena haematopus]|nr:hypothetical protein B0H12DRAFT_1328963 [Mycena haematopus]
MHFIDSPKVPPELEREIFELCVLMHPASALRLMLVAHRTKQWVEPLLYSTVILGGHFDSPPVHQVTTPSVPESPLASTSGVYPSTAIFVVKKDLRTLSLDAAARWIFSTGYISRTQSSPPLRPLHIQSLTTTIDSIKGVPFNGLFFTNLTHLTACRQWSEEWMKVSQVPNLTHLCFTMSIYYPCHCVQLLQTCRKLRVLVLHNGWGTQNSYKEALADDPRFVVIPWPYVFRDWSHRVSSGGEKWMLADHWTIADYWTIAEDLIARRDAGRVDRSTYVVEQSSGIMSK